MFPNVDIVIVDKFSTTVDIVIVVVDKFFTINKKAKERSFQNKFLQCTICSLNALLILLLRM